VCAQHEHGNVGQVANSFQDCPSIHVGQAYVGLPMLVVVGHEESVAERAGVFQ
jgi:hypothetical protein